MEYKKTDIDGVWIIEPKVFNDNRGYFYEVWKQADFDEHIGQHMNLFKTTNQSQAMAYCADFIIKKAISRKLNWCVC